MKGFKVFESDWTCGGGRFEVGEIYEIKGKPKYNQRGFHFCRELKDCFQNTTFHHTRKVAEVEALGTVDERDDEYFKGCCTNKIKLIKEISWFEVLRILNLGPVNTGTMNAGDHNSGTENLGDYNSGSCNSGYGNSGDLNSGIRNSGNGNTGHRNSGNVNAGCKNTGNYNTGNHNTGDWNACNWSTGCFNTEETEIYMFNKPSGLTRNQWYAMKAHDILDSMPQKLKWIKKESEKEGAPAGYLEKKGCKALQFERQEWWNRLSNEDKCEILNIPNFNKAIFKEITGINIE